MSLLFMCQDETIYDQEYRNALNDYTYIIAMRDHSHNSKSTLSLRFVRIVTLHLFYVGVSYLCDIFLREMINISAKLQNAWIRRLMIEWKLANDRYFKNSMRSPSFILSDSRKRLGYWKGGSSRTLALSVQLIKDRPWQDVCEILYHEMVHQYVDEVLRVHDEPPHGATFKRICIERGIYHRATGDISEWSRQRAEGYEPDNSGILNKVQKLLSLAQSDNEHEAELAINKASALLLKYNLSILEMDAARPYVHKQIGAIGRKNPAKSIASAIITKFFFVESIWIDGYDSATDTSGTILEISGVAANVQMAEYVFNYLLNISEVLWNKHKRDNNISGNWHRRTFINSLLDSFYHKLDDNSKSSGVSALVWKGDPLLAHYFKKRYPRVRTVQSGFSQSSRAISNAGGKAGKNLVINKGIENSSGFGGRLLNGR